MAVAHPVPLVQAAIDHAYAQWSESGMWPTVQWLNVMVRRDRPYESTFDAAQLARGDARYCFEVAMG